MTSISFSMELSFKRNDSDYFVTNHLVIPRTEIILLLLLSCIANPVINHKIYYIFSRKEYKNYLHIPLYL